MASAPQVIQISQPGKLVGGKLKVGELRMVDGKLTVKLTRKTIPLGDGIEVAGDVQQMPGCVALNVTAAAAKRHGWPHPANQPKHTAADLPRLRNIVGNEAYGEGEQEAAAQAIAEIEARG